MVTGFHWDDSNIEHISRHGIEPEEVEETFLGKRHTRKTNNDRYLLYGRTDNGRYLLVVYIIKEKRVRVITARDMTGNEKKLYKKRAK